MGGGGKGRNEVQLQWIDDGTHFELLLSVQKISVIYDALSENGN